MQIDFASLDTCHTATGLVVVIDVVRAFTTAAFAFAAGARRIILAGPVEQALALRERFPGALLMGELGGLLVPGFDLWNSPAQFDGLDLAGQTLIQRTSAGTQGVVRSSAAAHLLAASFVTAAPTVRAIQRLRPERVTFVLTGLHPQYPHFGREDLACAEYMVELLSGRQPNPVDYIGWTATFLDDHLVGAPADHIQKFSADLILCTDVDRFNFNMPVERRDGLLVMETMNDIPDHLS